MADESSTLPADDQGLRTEALDRLKRKRYFLNHLLVFVMVTASLWVIWAVTGRGFPWPIFPMVGWGLGLAFHGFDAFRRPFSEDDVQAEMQRLRQRG